MTNENVVDAQGDQKPIAWMRFWAAQRYTGHGNIECDEGFEVCKEGDKGVDGSPAFPVYAVAPASPASAPVAPSLSGVTRYTVYENCHAPEGHEIEPAPDGDYILYADAIAALAAPVAHDQAQGVPEGWKLVPVEPTEAMKHEPDVTVGGCYSCSGALVGLKECAEIYAAMLAAAPLPPAAAPAPAEAEDKRDAERYRFVRTADNLQISRQAARDPVAYDAAIDAAIQAQGSDAA